jgi:hypothetical protein
MKIHDFSYIFIENIENQLKILYFHDFPGFRGKSGKYEIHHPKFCAGLGNAMRIGTRGLPATTTVPGDQRIRGA